MKNTLLIINIKELIKLKDDITKIMDREDCPDEIWEKLSDLKDNKIFDVLLEEW